MANVRRRAMSNRIKPRKNIEAKLMFDDVQVAVTAPTAGEVTHTVETLLLLTNIEPCQYKRLKGLQIIPIGVESEHVGDRDGNRDDVRAVRRRKWEDREKLAREWLLSEFHCIKSSEVGKILFPTSKEARSSVAKRRENGEIIGLKLGRDYLYPDFQFDRDHNCVFDVVAHANTMMDAKGDPWGAAEWWVTSSDVLSGRTPLQVFQDGDLDRNVVNNIWKYEME